MEPSEYYKKIDEAYADHAKAEPLILYLIDKSREEYGEDSLFYASMLSEMGGYYRSAGRLEESEKYFSEASERIKAAQGPNHPEYATSVNNLAGTFRLQKKYAEAKEKFTECLGIYQKTVGETHPLYAATLNNLSLVSMDEGNYSTAAGYMMQCAEILKQHPESREEYATSLANLGSLMIRLEQPEKAMDCLSEAKNLYENELGTGTPHYYMILNSMGIAAYHLQKYRESTELFEKAAVEAKNMFGESNREYQMILAHLAKAREKVE